MYGFGKFQDAVIHFPSSSFQLIYGENEAGKTTLMLFIRYILFGFPTKQHKELRYEPKTSPSYGGKVIVEIEPFKEVTIERVKGKATGDVTVYFPDGTTRGEDALVPLFAGMDGSLFQGIFSFGVNDLHSMETLPTEQLGQYLYGVGMAGRASILELEKELQRSEEAFFKPNGKKPIVNEQLLELEKWSTALEEVEEKLGTYQQHLKEKEQLQKEREEITVQIKKLHEELQQLDKLKILAPLIKRKKALLYQLETLPDTEHFPMDGLEKRKELSYKIQHLQEQKQELEKKIEINIEKEKAMEVRRYSQRELEQVMEFQEKVIKYEQLIVDEELVSEEMRKVKNELEIVLTALGPTWQIDDIKRCETSVRAKELLRINIQKEKKLEEVRGLLNIEIGNKEVEIINRREAIDKLVEKKQRIPKINNKREEWHQIKNEIKEKNLLEQEIRLLNTELSAKQDMAGGQVLPFLLALMAAWAAYLHQWGIVVIATMLTFLTLYFSFHKRRNMRGRLEKLIKAKEEKRQQLMEEQLEERLRVIELQLAEEEQLENEIGRTKSTLEQEEANLLRLLDRRTEVQRNQAECKKGNQLWSETFFFPTENKTADALLELFHLVEKGKRLLIDLNDLECKLNKLKREQLVMEEEGQNICILFSLDGAGSLRRIADRAQAYLKKEEETYRKKEAIKNEISIHENEKAVLNEKLSFLEEEYKTLLYNAATQTEEEFSRKGLVAKQKLELEKELISLEGQIASVCPIAEEREQIEGLFLDEQMDVTRKWEEINGLLSEKLKAEKKLQELIIHHHIQLEELEKGKNYAALQQQGEFLKNKLRENAKKWAVYKAGRLMLQKAKAVYEEEKQPVVLTKAADYFSIMTGGKYVKLLAPVGQETFVVENKNGMRFTPEELSQGTTEQLYLSLRLALAAIYQKHMPFPIILDDILVNFDGERKIGAKKVIKKMAEKHQIIMFTCHADIVQLFDEKVAVHLA